MKNKKIILNNIIGSISMGIMIVIGAIFIPDRFGNLADWLSAISTLGAVLLSFNLSNKANREINNRDRKKEKRDGYYVVFHQISNLKEDISLHSTDYKHWKMIVDADMTTHFNKLERNENITNSELKNTLSNSKNVNSLLSRWKNNWQLSILAENILEKEYLSEYKQKYEKMITGLGDIIKSVEDNQYDVSPDKIQLISDLENLVLKSYNDFNK
ncbi:hypothetical protein H9L19_06365 [Weissella diestrammenae]|uniref:Uncharacterized protein n=1 Tax=Weissella diestrammenae TaxID=1162633 RepID=A0A7G9T4I1_9LACO|nr:hypothetical protein [Weissella diestrammenae]MCM0582140.1 hypothetical protein [Weissella diestrammenae]QNN75006.1 hypothetical protein H9L19_06365 [Weissella diestrammenae]